MATNYVSEYTVLNNILAELKEVTKRENKRHQMDQHLTFSMLALLEDEIIPLLENELDVDYEPDETGEPPMTADEMHSAAWKQHQELHRWVDANLLIQHYVHGVSTKSFTHNVSGTTPDLSRRITPCTPAGVPGGHLYFY